MGESGPTTLKRRRHTPEQIIHKLAEGNRLLGLGKDLEESPGTSRSPSRAGIGGGTSTAG